MSIQLRNGFENEPIDRILEDLLARFVINCPPEDLSSIERVYFQIEEAHWFYLDFILQVNPKLLSMKMKTFSTEILKKCPLLWKWGDPDVAINTFNNYKRRIPVRGACLFNAACDKVLLVKGTESRSWSFPRGKIGKDETDTECCLREIKEEIGYDASNQMDEESYVERTIQGKNYKIYMLKNIPDDVQFVPEARNEISEIKWFDFKKLVKKCRASPKGFFLVGNMLQQMIQYNKKQKGGFGEEELKRDAERKLKALLGIKGQPEGNVDAGREILNMLTKGSEAPQFQPPQFFQPPAPGGVMVPNFAPNMPFHPFHPGMIMPFPIVPMIPPHPYSATPQLHQQQLHHYSPEAVLVQPNASGQDQTHGQNHGQTHGQAQNQSQNQILNQPQPHAQTNHGRVDTTNSRELLQLLSNRTILQLLSKEPKEAKLNGSDLLSILKGGPLKPKNTLSDSHELLGLLKKVKGLETPAPLERKNSAIQQARKQSVISPPSPPFAPSHASEKFGDDEYSDYEDYEDAEGHISGYENRSFDHFEIDSDYEHYQSDEEEGEVEEDEVEDAPRTPITPGGGKHNYNNNVASNGHGYVTNNGNHAGTSHDHGGGIVNAFQAPHVGISQVQAPKKKFTLLKRGQDISAVDSAAQDATPEATPQGSNPLLELLEKKSQVSHEPAPAVRLPDAETKTSNPLLDLLKRNQSGAPSAHEPTAPTSLLNLLKGGPQANPQANPPNAGNAMAMNNIGLMNSGHTSRNPVDEFIQSHTRIDNSASSGSNITPDVSSTGISAKAPEDPAIMTFKSSGSAPQSSQSEYSNPLLSLLKQSSQGAQPPLQGRPVPISLDALEASLSPSHVPLPDSAFASPQPQHQQFDLRNNASNGHATSLLGLLKGNTGL
ncbi:hypothetical protein BABINDRAFT_163892 [Babjeviella inositovora NRRL Y-12698]|uniref:Nudix hydrolase domain-containing protein n=1 Tax=Babjeviella inositovora NRRL Y-12698 TaxID=984486 RepID=A0A1E3QH16_9ASCO|nr:uncharacterized protein BABINDRAFT_163892 [Babjeviella inositovora NRRL Y-12698]ODQ76989.1 hypothetical protein BABINDRAFT_163892 [Babjeviella inositovora NRRL Y-12698]